MQTDLKSGLWMKRNPWLRRYLHANLKVGIKFMPPKKNRLILSMPTLQNNNYGPGRDEYSFLYFPRLDAAQNIFRTQFIFIFFEAVFLTYFHHKSYLKKPYKINIYETPFVRSFDCFYFFLPG